MSFNLLSDYSLEYVSYYDIVSYRNILCIQLFSTALFSIRHYVGEGRLMVMSSQRRDPFYGAWSVTGTSQQRHYDLRQVHLIVIKVLSALQATPLWVCMCMKVCVCVCVCVCVRVCMRVCVRISKPIRSVTMSSAIVACGSAVAPIMQTSWHVWQLITRCVCVVLCSCYFNSVFQVLFTVLDFQRR